MVRRELRSQAYPHIPLKGGRSGATRSVPTVDMPSQDANSCISIDTVLWLGHGNDQYLRLVVSVDVFLLS